MSAVKEEDASGINKIEFHMFLDLPDVCIMKILSYLSEKDLFYLDWAYTVRDPFSRFEHALWTLVSPTGSLDEILFLQEHRFMIKRSIVSVSAFSLLTAKIDLISEKIRSYISRLPIWKRRQSIKFTLTLLSERMYWQFIFRNAGAYVSHIIIDSVHRKELIAFIQLVNLIDEYCPQVKKFSLSELQHPVLNPDCEFHSMECCLQQLSLRMMRAVESLTLTFNHERRDQFDFVLLAGFPNLTSLSIRHSCVLDDKALMDLSLILKSLKKHLTFFSCHHCKVTERGIIPFLRLQLKIRELDLTRCHLVDFSLLGPRLNIFAEKMSPELRITYDEPGVSPPTSAFKFQDEICDVCHLCHFNFPNSAKRERLQIKQSFLHTSA